jgi:tetratricopeptide (TPR) repeat protein
VNKSQQQTDIDWSKRLEEAWGLGIQGYYEAALALLDSLLKENSSDVRALRLKGNLLELKEMDRQEYGGKKLVSSTDYLAARGCYEKILEVEPGYVKAYIDLGDHYRNLDANDKALEYYRKAVRVLEQTPRDETWKEDAEELLQAVALLTKHDRLAAEASLLEAWCKQSLG